MRQTFAVHTFNEDKLTVRLVVFCYVVVVVVVGGGGVLRCSSFLLILLNPEILAL